MTVPSGTPDPNQPGAYRPSAEGSTSSPTSDQGATVYPPQGGQPYLPGGSGAAGYPTSDQGATVYPPPSGQPYLPGGASAAGYPAPGQGATSFPPPSGQPYIPGATGAAGFPPPGMIPPPPSLATNKKKQRILLAVALIVVAAIVTFVVIKQQKTAITSANPGDCVKVTSATMTNPETSQAPCGDQAAIYVVTATGSGDITCDSHEDSYVQGNDNNPDTRVCLRPNLHTGDCWDPGLTSFDVPKKIDCTGATGLRAQKVVALITTSADEAQCPDTAEKVLPLEKRNMVYCFASIS
ncbi:MAG: hypothetical protein M3Y35_14995 [Actinomycetota bacterium]|nr:hypothetical protein [Actinomycetota bacterium]